jgi:hypothetical protein
MLFKVEEFGRDKGYFQYTKIGLLNSTPVQNTKTDVIDFDKTKDILYKGDRNQPKSCDALKLICEKNRLDFLELKSVIRIIENTQRTPPRPIEASIEDIRTKIPDKLKGSKKIMELVVNHEDLSLSQEDLSEYAACSKNFYLIVDNDISQDGFSTFYFNMVFSSAFKQIERENSIIVKGLMEVDNMYENLV